jgi:hypothetical protein
MTRKKRRKGAEEEPDENKRKGRCGMYYRRKRRDRNFNDAKVPGVAIVCLVEVSWREGSVLRCEGSKRIGNCIFMQQKKESKHEG